MLDLDALRQAVAAVHIVSSGEEREQLLETLIGCASERPHILNFFNQNAANLLMKNAEFRRDFLAMDMVLRDGIGARMALGMLGKSSGLNMNGTDLIPTLVEAYSQLHPDAPLFFLGTSEPWLREGANRLVGMHRGKVLVLDGFRSVEHYAAALTPYADQFKLVVLGMGMPKQERVAMYLQHEPIGPALIVCGGAVIDFAAGRFSRAPEWMRKSGMEWLYRLGNEPRRLFKRYVVGIPIFLSCVLLSRMQMRFR